MPVTKRDARRLVDEVVADRERYLQDRHAVFCHRRFLPALRRLERGRITSRDRERLTAGWNDVGLTHDLCEAPRAAMRAYRRALDWGPDNAWAHGELAEVLLQLRRPRAARRHARIAIELDPDDDMGRTYLEWADEANRRGFPPARPDPLAGLRERLAQGQPRALLRRLQHPTTTEERQLRARAQGLLGDLDAQLAEWAAVAAGDGPVEIGIADWFFAHEDLVEQSRWWRTLLTMLPRIRDWYGPWFDSLWEAIPEPPRGDHGSAAGRRRARKRLRMLFEYHLARTQPNKAAARRLKQRNPDWPEAVDLVRELENGQ